MRSLRYHQSGKPREVLAVEEIPKPTPGPGEVRVRMTHRPINPADLHTILGSYGKPPSLPGVGGHEGVGRVDEIGAGVAAIIKGQRVVPMGVEGTWQEFVIVAAEQCVPVPEELNDEQAAQLFVNPLTGLLMLEDLDPRESQWILQTAGSSQVGRIVTQLASIFGLRSISIVRRPDARDELLSLGADAVIVADAESDARLVRKQVLELTGGRGADGAVDGVAGRVGGVVARCLAPDSTMLVYGGLSGNPLSIDAGTFIFQRICVRGFWRTRWYDTHPPEDTASRLNRLAELVRRGELALPAEATYDLADYREAIEHSRRPGTGGKVLLTG